MKKTRKVLWKKWCAGIFALCLAIVGALAGGLPGDIVRSLPGGLVEALPAELAGEVPGSVVCIAHAEESDVAMGRYLESEVTLPAEDFVPMDIVRTAEGTLRIIGSRESETSYTIWDSADGGASWEQTGALPEEYGGWFRDIDLSPAGGGVAIGLDVTYRDDGDTPEYLDYVIVFDAQGNVTVRKDCDNSYMVLDFAQDGQLIGAIVAGEVVRLDPATAEITGTIAKSADMIGTCGQEALVLTSTELQRYDIETGEPHARDEALEDALYANRSEFPYAITTSNTVPIVMTEDEEGRLYYGAKNEGIFAHAMDGSVVEQVVDGTLGTLASPSTELCAMTVLDQCFYLVCIDGVSGEYKLLKYEYSADTPSVPQKELTVYSLFEGSALRQAITLFQTQYPDTYVNYEVGMSGEDGVTVSDALRTLNTEILAGNGPDILVLDSLPVDSYVEQGLLMDLSGIVADLRDSEGLMDNIVGAYEQDGAFYTIPQRFGIVMVAGDPELIGGIDSMDAIEALAAQPGVLAVHDIAILSDLLYRVSAGSWKNEDGTLDQEKLTEYVHAVRQIMDTWKANAPQEDLEGLDMYRQDGMTIGWNEMEAIGMRGDDLTSATLDLLTRTNGVWLGALYQMLNYCGLTSVNAQTGACAMALPNLTEEKFFVPCGLLGVLGNSKEPEQAAEFVRFLLSAQAQGQINSDGFPVNRTALETLMNTNSLADGYGISSSSGDGDDFISLDYEWPTDTELSALMEMARQVSVPVETEHVQQDVVIEEMRRCLDGEIGEEETVNAILQRINLYLAE